MFVINRIICDINDFCYFSESKEINYITIFGMTMLLISIIGIFNNIICIIIFKYSNTNNTEGKKFFLFLYYYTINSLMINLNDLINYSIYLLTNAQSEIYRKIENNSLYLKTQVFIIYFSYFYQNIWAIIYTFGTFMDTFIVYERIQLYNPKWKFLSKTSAGKISLFVFLFSLVLNVPVNLSRNVIQNEFFTSTNKSVLAYSYALREFEQNNNLFTLSIIVSNFFRDGSGSMIIGITINIILIVTIK